MKRSIQNIVFSVLSVALASMALSSSVKAAEPMNEADLTIHQLRMAELDRRTKGYNTVNEGTSLHQKVTAQRDARNKVGDRLSTTSLIVQRQRVLDRNSK